MTIPFHCVIRRKMTVREMVIGAVLFGGRVCGGKTIM